MNRKALKKILEEIVAGKELVPLFIESGLAPSTLYWALKAFQQTPDMGLAQKITAKKKVSPHYLLDRVSSLVDQIDEFRGSNPYSTLNVTYQADLASIRKNWKSLLKEWHPDKMADGADTSEMARKINAAYRTLKEPEQRKQYDTQYAPLLAIVKDIEEQPPPTFYWKPPKWTSGRKLSLMGAALLTAGGFLWYVHSHRPPAPLQPAVKQQTRPLPALPSVNKTADSTRPIPGGKPSLPLRKAESPPLPPVSAQFHAIAWVKGGQGVSGSSGKNAFVVFKPRKTRQAAGMSGHPRGMEGMVSYHFRPKQPSAQVIAKVSPPSFDTEKSRIKKAAMRPATDKKQEKPPVPPPQPQKGLTRSSPPIPPPNVRPATSPRSVHLSPAEKVVEQYVSFYRTGNFPGLFMLFDRKAKENGIPIRESLGNYRIFLRHLKVVRFDLIKTTGHKVGKRYIYAGRYTVEYKQLANHGHLRREGRISFVLIREKSHWFIQELNYSPN